MRSVGLRRVPHFSSRLRPPSMLIPATRRGFGIVMAPDPVRTSQPRAALRARLRSPGWIALRSVRPSDAGVVPAAHAG